MNHSQIITERFVLRPLQPEDASLRYSSWLDEPQAVRHIVSARKPHDVAALRAYIEERTGRADVLFLGIFLRSGCGMHIGNIKYEPVDENNGHAVMGILIGDPAWRGVGAAGEAILASADWLARHRHIDRIVLGVARDHSAAIRTYQKIGFRQDASNVLNVDLDVNLVMTLQLGRAPG